MKKRIGIKWISAVLVLLMAFAVLSSGCSKNDEPAPAPESSTSDEPAPESSESPVQPEPSEEPEPAPDPAEMAEISERAMENFIAKISGGNYVLSSDGFMKTVAFSKDMVLFDYEDDETYSDFAVMSVNNEVFQGFLENDGVRDVSFLEEGSALETAKAKLPSYWLADEVSEGNIYNLFYNDPEDPLKFVSYDAAVQNQLRTFAGYGDVALKYMHEVYLTLDQEDPATAHLQAEVDDDEVARYYFDDIDVTITFGNAQSDPRVDAWMKAPAYPEARTEWTEGDLFIFNSVFLPGYGEKAIPYIPSASYALSIDEENFINNDEVDIRDPHAAQADIDSYVEILKQNGFAEVTEDGETWYRFLLREDTKCYSSISVEYDGGLNLVARKYYDMPKFEGFDQVNGQIVPAGYPALPETEALTDFTATEAKFEQTESWLYFYNYETVLYVYAHYGDYDQVMDYLDAYAEELVQQGYTPVYIDGEEGGEIDYYRSADESKTFRYHFEDDDETVILLYKAEKCLSADEAKAILNGAGFPEIDLTAYSSGRDHKKFQKIMYGKDYDTAVSLSVRFDTTEEAEAFLDGYVALLEEDDYLRVPPSDMGSNKTNGYTNEEKGMGVAFDLFPGESGETLIYFDFRSGIDFETEGDEADSPLGPLGWKFADETAPAP